MSPLRARVAREIVAIIRREGLPKGSHLVETELALKIGVSRSPVSHALRHLAAEGLLVHDPNRGFYLLCDSGEVEEFADLPGGVDEELYERMADDRLSGALPDRISEAELLRIYGAARSRLLGVLARIAAEGWIERQAGRGWRFAHLIESGEAYAESYAFRAALEPQALLLPTFRADPEELAAQRKRQLSIRDGANLSLGAPELFEANSEFHETLAGWSGNRFVLMSLRKVDRLRRLVEYRKVKEDRVARATQAGEHLEILDLIEAGRLEDCSRLLRDHILRAGKAKAFH